MNGMLQRYLLAALLGAALLSGGCTDDDDPPPPPDGGAPVCGNGIVEGTELCDDGNPKSMDGCEADCTYSCDEDADCNDGDDCDGTEVCHPTLHRCQAGAPLSDGSACTYYVALPASGDGGVGGGLEARMDGVCISEACGRPCTMPSDCDDGNVCNGVETCGNGIFLNNCAPGAAPDCDDSYDCTIDSCDPVSGCSNVLIDGDMDNFADDDLSCDAPRAGDCNDADATVYPGAAELCNDGKDNDCDGLADTADPQQPTWYQDCDGDGFAAMGAVNLTQCEMPATTPVCLNWTTTTPVGVDYTDCDDAYDVARPGATGPVNGFFDRPYCRGAGAQATGTAPSFSCAAGSLNWDYDCNGLADRASTVVDNTCSGLFRCDHSGGWTGAYAPSCGYTGEWSDCYLSSGCGDIGCLRVCNVWSTYTKQQTCR